MVGRVEQLEEIEQKLDDFYNNLNDIDASLHKYEGKISAHTMLGSAANDRKYLEKIKVATVYDRA